MRPPGTPSLLLLTASLTLLACSCGPQGGGASGANRAGLGEHQTIDGVSVAVMTVTAERLDDGRECVAVGVGVGVKDSTRSVPFDSWHMSVRLRDNFGNAYRPVGPGMTSANSVRAGQPAGDALAFERPIPTATHLDLDLPGENVGIKGKTFRFRFPPPKK
jgi:hypothetical protein